MWQHSPLIVDLLSRTTFPVAGSVVTCAVSGGADSLALLALAVAAGLNVTAIHVDHGLRPESASEADIVRLAAESLGAQFRAVSVEVGQGPNLEARARQARYEALPDEVLTGHTADDQAETVLLNILRGAGVDGLAGIRPTGGPSHQVGHPLLAIRRAETEAVCELLQWTPVSDPSNNDHSLLRNRIRQQILPVLNEAAHRDLTPILSRQAALMADDSDLLDELAAHIDPTDAKALAGAPVALARRAIRRWLSGNHPPDAASVERVLAVARGEVIACELPGGFRISRTNQRISITPTPAQD
jgi:tRNA(Ile)-lysidine synthase